MTNEPNPDGLWGGENRGDNRLALTDLIANNTLDTSTAALLWLMVEKKLSFIVAAAPQRAGKTTLLSALLDLAPPSFTQVYTRGQDEDFSFLTTTEAANTYILVPEISNHTPDYLWGENVKTLFQAMDDGYSLAATVHADTPEEIVWMLGGAPLNIPFQQIANIDIVVNIALMYGENDFIRRISNMSLLTPDQNVRELVTWESDTDSFNRGTDSRAIDALAQRLHMSVSDVEADIASRSDTLQTWLEASPEDSEAFKKLVAQHYGG